MALTTKEFAPKPQRRKIAATVAAAAVVVGAVAVVTHHGDHTGTHVAASVPSRHVAAPASPAVKGSLVPQRPALIHRPTDPDWLTGVPAGIVWERVDGVPLPFGGADGPSHIAGAVASGYSHTPQGAVLAALQIGFRLALSPDYAQVAAAQTVLSPQTAAQLDQARGSAATVPAQTVALSTSQPVAFKVAAYSPAAATIDYAFPTRSPGTDKFLRSAVVWSGGDWKFSDHPDPSTSDLPPSSDLSGFTKF